MNNPTYILGHSEREISRLKMQARLIEPATRQFMREAGITAGMRVLDVGSGAGDVALLAAELVGATGEVVGCDVAAAAVAAATHNAWQCGSRNVSFRVGDAAQMEFDGTFDAVVGRYVLLFQADPAAMLRRLARRVRPGGLVLFHEPDWQSARSIPPAPTYDRCCGWIRSAFRIARTDGDMAGKLYAIFVAAGLGAPAMRMQTFIAGSAMSSDFLQALADLVASVVPAMESQGIATASEVGAESLAERLRQEVTENASVIMGRSEIGVWARV